jgi:hypothetical protein
VAINVCVCCQVCHLISERINEEFDSAMAAADALHRYRRLPCTLFYSTLFYLSRVMKSDGLLDRYRDSINQ